MSINTPSTKLKRTIVVDPDNLPSLDNQGDVIRQLIRIHSRHEQMFPKDLIVLKIDANFGIMDAKQDSKGYPKQFLGTELQFGSKSGWTFRSWPKSAVK